MVPGNFAFEVAHSRYTALFGVGATDVDFRKNCQLNLAVFPPPGYTYAVNRTNHHGSGSLTAGANASLRSNHYIKGPNQTAYATHRFTSPLDTDWQSPSTCRPPPSSGFRAEPAAT